ncbi:uncharacterized protein VTP21DRAFT_781 [Calcarisporiella thermophila]|uniref:uncharacterized protein n=1 Tax=Calcarisporiella thermophila TaxID=911321 RepID=UPI003743A540
MRSNMLYLCAWWIATLLLSAGRVIGGEASSDYLVRNLPGLPQHTKLTQYAGHVEINSKTNSNIFFWLFERLIKTEKDKLVIWLNGGPGCSSEDGVFLENGPFRIKPDLTLAINSGAWNKYATVLFVDQPPGTGLSYADTNHYAKSIDEVVDKFMVFLDKFFDMFPKYKKSELYITGESYAGIYIPYFTTEILKRNKYNLQAIAIGNPWMDPWHQYQAYYTFSVDKGLLKGEAKNEVKKILDACMEKQQKEGIKIHTDSCEEILHKILNYSIIEEGNQKTCINEYDIRGRDTYPSCGMNWPFELANITKYLQRPDVLEAVHATGKTAGWVECAKLVSKNLKDDGSSPSVTLLSNILKHIPVMIYSGDQDLICNHYGTDYMIANLTWNGGVGMDSQPSPWYINGKKAGTIQTSRNLTYAIVYDASHMVPYDKPDEMLDLINQFMGIRAGAKVMTERLMERRRWEEQYDTVSLLIIAGSISAVVIMLWFLKAKKRVNQYKTAYETEWLHPDIEKPILATK